MDGSDVSLAIRRARRSGAKQLDLSCRGLREWPEGIFSLRQLEVVDVSGNELKSLDSGIKQLELLEELNLSNNKFESLPIVDTNALTRLRSLQLDGNPVASRVASTTLRQLARPPATLGQTPAQVIHNLLGLATAGGSAASGGAASRPSSATMDKVQSFEDEPEARSEAPSWLRPAKPMAGEVEGLQTRVRELEGQLADARQGPGAAEPKREDSGSGLPAWLQQDSRKDAMLSATLPSRRGAGGIQNDEVADLKAQLKEEQRKSKRLEQDVQRMTNRLNEREMQKQNIGSVPHFEFSEVQLGEMINQGGFSVVHYGEWHKTQVAVKKLFDPKIDQALLDEFDNEVQKLEQLRHPNILMLMGVHRKPPALSIITELVEGGSFYQLLHTPSKFNSAGPAQIGRPLIDTRKTLEILESTGTAMAFLHGRGIAHRDIKSQNVLLTPNLEVKLCDFGLARMRSELMTGAMQFAGTPNYMAPEIFRNEKYSENVDVWAFGVMFWEALAMDIPFANLDPGDIREKVFQGKMPEMNASFPSQLQAIIKACWTIDRNLRPPMADIVSRLQDNLKEDTAGRSRPERPRTANPAGAPARPSGFDDPMHMPASRRGGPPGAPLSRPGGF